MSRPALVLGRRSLLAASSALALARPLGAQPQPPVSKPAWRKFELAVPADARGARRALVALPVEAAASAPLPLLVLLHGLGETNDEHAGTHAWLERYGMGNAWERLRQPPLKREKSSFLSEAEHEQLNRCLARRPFAGLCVVCPYLPNPRTLRDPGFARYAAWLAEALLPAVRDRVPEATRSPTQTGLAGVSLGGFVAIEAALQRPEHFATVGSVQGAFGVERAAHTAKRLAANFSGQGRRLYIATSQGDPYRGANQALVRELGKLGVRAHSCLRKGPHNQPWLRDIGSLDLLLWHDRALRAPVATADASDEACCGG